MTSFRMLPLPEHIDALGAVLGNLDDILMTDTERAEALIWAWEGMRAQGINVRVVRDSDTHPKDGDVKQAPLVSGAGRETASPQPIDTSGKNK